MALLSYCRLSVDCESDPLASESAFTAPVADEDHHLKTIDSPWEEFTMALLSYCRLSVDCESDPLASESVFTAPVADEDHHLKTIDSPWEEFTMALLSILDEVCIPVIMVFMFMKENKF